ncbi:hypothetical protein JOF56_001730 [Kibdelosporangium banguiense]|uniref:DUF6779 domain-containing protein n=1 Tax=Kibdelosporangium banguiense TaxID=1365924 RepID=A0ABS4TA96_9PSEU|nr:DUF6779 domain-containing protein [Kibdelosporangium banguiense]MBP2321345.1 hypothetical protein [Kibdelosporangium banguiense]
MSSRAVSPRDASRVPSTARLLLGGALVLAIGATLVLVFSDDSRFLKLGIVAALWAALVGAFLAARLRRQVADRQDESKSMQAIYELELEREIAARREYELELEAEAKRKAEEQSRQDIDALRTELGALRETLQTLLGGEVLVERFALQAQATRMRPMADEAHQLPPQNQMMKRLNPSPAAPSQPVIIPGEPQTEMMGRVPGSAPQSQPRRETRPQPQRPAPQRPARSPSERQVQVSQPLAQPRVRDEDPGSGWWEPVVQPGAAADPRRQEYRQPVAGESVNSLGESIDMSWTPSWERNAPAQPPQAARQQPGRPPRPPKKPEPQPSRPMQRPTEAETRQTPLPAKQPVVEAPTQIQPLPEPIPARPPEPPARAAEASMRSAPVAPPVREPSMRGVAPVPPPNRSAESSVRVTPVRKPEPPPPPPPPVRKPDPSSRVVQPPDGPDAGGRRRADDSASGRRRAPEPGPAAAQDAGGRRRRADDAPSWQETLQARNSGTHAKPPPPPEPSGSHAEGKSVNELLAAYGNAETPRRRRRRDD